MTKIKDIIKELTINEKVELTTGINNWETKALENHGIPSIVMSDGPHGIRKEQISETNKNIFNSVPATAFPTASLAACSFDKELMTLMGEALGNDALEQKVDILLGPGVNTKRSPLCGRNFEYYSEDPLLSGELAAAYINGVQSKGVGTSLKHFFANSQEFRRVTASSNADERTLRELYLTNFEIAVKKGKPWTVMPAYNKINGVFATENTEYNENLLYESWGYDGCLISDWGASHERLKSLKGGTAITMPSDKENNERISLVVKNDKELENIVDKNCERILNLGLKVNNKKISSTNSLDSLAIAQKVVEESLVLLKNNDGILPLSSNKKIAFIGQFAKVPRAQGGGSSHVNSIRVISAIEAVKDITDVAFSKGYLEDGSTSSELITEAIKTAKENEQVVLFVGLPETSEREGVDRTHMNLPEGHNELINAVTEVNSNVIVVLHNGAPVEMPWADKVQGIIETYLGGDAVGQGVVNAIFGIVNPSGRLAESFPYKLEDNPSYLFYRGELDNVEYREGVFVGYRYYETKKMPVRYPFGHGLSYTSFSYSNLVIEKDENNDLVNVSVSVKNTGNLAGKEVVQLYVSPSKGVIIRPIKELKGFEKIDLNPNEIKTVSFSLDRRAFSYWNMDTNDWGVETGDYSIIIGKNANEVILQDTINITGDATINSELTPLSSIGQLFESKKGLEYWNNISDRFIQASSELGYSDSNEESDTSLEEQFEEQNGSEVHDLFLSLPLVTISQIISDYSSEDLQNDLDKINEDDWRLY